METRNRRWPWYALQAVAFFSAFFFLRKMADLSNIRIVFDPYATAAAIIAFATARAAANIIATHDEVLRHTWLAAVWFPVQIALIAWALVVLSGNWEDTLGVGLLLTLAAFYATWLLGGIMRLPALWRRDFGPRDPAARFEPNDGSFDPSREPMFLPPRDPPRSVKR